MTDPKHKNIFESHIDSTFSPPAVELLSDPAKAAAAWPKNIAENQEFLEQIESRKRLNDQLDAVISNLPRPDISLEKAISENYVTEKQVANLYESLTSLLESSDYKRIVFYIPFEFLPNASWQPILPELKQAAEQFRAAYMAAWNDLLTVHDVRANFVDGDVLEVKSRKGDLPRVVKAAHLIPKLIEKGLLSVEDIIELLEDSDDETLKQSIADTFPVLTDLGFIQDKQILRMQKSHDPIMHDLVTTVTSSKENSDQGEIKEGVTLSLIQNKLDADFKKIDAEEYDDITEKRKAWLRQDKKRKAVELLGDKISSAIIYGALSDRSLSEFLSDEADPVSQIVLIDGLRKAVEEIAQTDTNEAQKLYDKYHEALLSLWKLNIPPLRDALSKTFCRLHGLKIVSDEELSNFGLVVPKLAGPFSENLKSMEAEMKELREIIASVEKDPETSKYVYPVVLVFGSRLKGYGTKDADIDIAVFVRPETPVSDAEKMRALLKQKFASKNIRGEIVEFWLLKTASGLDVRDLESSESFVGNGSWTHVLFGAAWEGNEDAIKELRDNLLVPYFYDDKKTIFDREARGLYIEELERDTLQYRLMHRGYANFFPAYGGIRTPHADRIDGQSIFWDSGYRQMATKLFASRVFLPKISRPT